MSDSTASRASRENGSSSPTATAVVSNEANERQRHKQDGHTDTQAGSNEKNQVGTTSKKSSFSALVEKIQSFLPPWAAAAIVDSRKWKTFARCLIATFATMILMVCQRSLNAIGSAAFFALIVSQILPPFMSVSIYVFIFSMVCIGMLTGWAWGCAAMAAGLRARSQVLLKEVLLREQSTFSNNANPDAEYKQAIFDGAYLDPRTSTVFGVFFFFGVYFGGWIKAKKPRLTIAAIYYHIILDLMCSFGPLFPFANYTIAYNLLVPAACFLAISLASCFLIFPQTLHQVVLDGTIKACLTPCLGLLKLQDQILATSPSDHTKWTELAGKASALRKASTGGIMAVGGQLKMLQLEVSRSRMGPGELARVFDKVKELGIKGHMLSSFLMILEERYQSIQKVKDHYATNSKAHPMPRAKREFDNSEKYTHEGQNIEMLVPLLQSETAELRAAGEKALEDSISWLNELNHTRWRKPKLDSPPITIREENLRNVRTALEDFRSSKQMEILAPFKDSFDDQGNFKLELVEETTYSAKDLFRCYVFTTHLVSFTEVLIDYLELLLEIERNNPKARIQWPTMFAKMLVRSANDTSGGGGLEDNNNLIVQDNLRRNSPESSQETLVDLEEGQGHKKVKKEKTKKVYARDPDARDPKNFGQKFGRKLGNLWRILSSPAGIFALKQGLVSIAVWTPAVAPASAKFVYENRGLWALIMCQTGMSVFTGEQIGGFILRMGGTIVGLVVGMVAWYCGAGHGPGSAYGIVASTTFFVAPLLWARVCAPMKQVMFWLMASVTLVLVIGYGWVDGHIYETANQGWGASLAGRRALLVIIGFTATFIVMLFPKPISAKVIVRKTLAVNITDMADLYGDLVTGVEDEGEIDTDVDGLEDGVGGEDGNGIRKDVAKRQIRYRASFLKMLAGLGQLEVHMKYAGFEPGINGSWPKDVYHEIYHVQGQITHALAIFAGGYARMTPKWCKILSERSEFMHPAFIADCFTLFSLLHKCLANATPLPPTMPIFERLQYHQQLQHRRVAATDFSDRIINRPVPSTTTAKTGRVRGLSISQRPIAEDSSYVEREQGEARAMEQLRSHLTWDVVNSEQFANYATCHTGLVAIVSGLNQLHRLVVSLVGEKDLEGFERAHERFARMEAAAHDGAM